MVRSVLRCENVTSGRELGDSRSVRSTIEDVQWNRSDDGLLYPTDRVSRRAKLVFEEYARIGAELFQASNSFSSLHQSDSRFQYDRTAGEIQRLFVDLSAHSLHELWIFLHVVECLHEAYLRSSESITVNSEYGPASDSVSASITAREQFDEEVK